MKSLFKKIFSRSKSDSEPGPVTKRSMQWQAYKDLIPTCHECKEFKPYPNTDDSQDCRTCIIYRNTIMNLAPTINEGNELINKILVWYKNNKELYDWEDYEK